MKRTIVVGALAILAFVLGQTNSAPAAMITFSTLSNAALDDGRPVNAQATFVTSTDLVTITLRDLQIGIKDIEQSISGVSFAFNSLKTGTTIVSSSGLERTIHANKSFTDGLTVPTGWTVLLDGQSMQLMLPDSMTSHTIIGPAAGLSYTGANATIAGDANDNPFLVGPVTFLVKVPGITSATQVDWATFHFGVCAQYRPLCQIANVPEPSTLVLGIVGGLALVAAGRRRK